MEGGRGRAKKVTLMNKSKAKASKEDAFGPKRMQERGSEKEKTSQSHHCSSKHFPHLGTKAASLKAPSLALCLQSAQFDTPS